MQLEDFFTGIYKVSDKFVKATIAGTSRSQTTLLELQFWYIRNPDNTAKPQYWYMKISQATMLAHKNPTQC